MCPLAGVPPFFGVVRNGARAASFVGVPLDGSRRVSDFDGVSLSRCLELGARFRVGLGVAVGLGKILSKWVYSRL